MNSKKGAIELSLSTIIIVILGVVLLILGLTFVSGIFEKTETLTGNAFDEAHKSLQDMGRITQDLTVAPTKVEMDQSEEGGAGIVVKNLEKEQKTYQIKVRVGAETEKGSSIDCFIGETESRESEQFTLESGKEMPFSLIVKDRGESALDSYLCTVELYDSGTMIKHKAVTIVIR